MDNEEQEISVLKWMGYQILFAIPLVNIICLLIFAFGENKNTDLKNYARAYLIFWVILMLLSYFIGTVVASSIISSLPALY